MRGAIRKQHKRQQETADYEEKTLSAPPMTPERTRREKQHNNFGNEASLLHSPIDHNV